MGRNKILKIRIDSDEYKKLFEYVDKSGKYGNMSDYIRHLVASHSRSFKKTTKKESANLMLSYHLSRIGNNLNQVAYQINKANLADKVNSALVDEVLQELLHTNIMLNELLEKGVKKNV